MERIVGDPASPRLRLGVRWIASLFSLLLLTPALADGAGEATAPEPLVVAADRWCPYNCEPGSSRPGYLVEVLREVFEPSGMKVIYRVMPWKRAVFETELGRIDGALGAVAGDRGRNLIGTEGLGTNATVIVVRRGEAFRYTGPHSLDNRAVGVVADYSYDSNGSLDRYLQQRHESDRSIYVVRQDAPLRSLFAMLERGRIDAFPENRYVARYAIGRMGLLDSVALVETGRGDAVYVAFSPNARGRRLVDQLDAGVRRLRASGRLAEIMARYGIRVVP